MKPNLGDGQVGILGALGAEDEARRGARQCQERVHGLAPAQARSRRGLGSEQGRSTFETIDSVTHGQSSRERSARVLARHIARHAVRPPDVTHIGEQHTR